MTKLFLFDIEGTTTDINFVHKVLFPYSKERMKEYVLEHKNNPAIQKAMEDVKLTVKTEEHIQLTDYEVINRLEKWIEHDRKHSALKEIQGLIWEEGYKKADFQAHVYEDVKPFFEAIKQKGMKIGIYSSGSVRAQKLLMGHCVAGDLDPYITYYFDTKMGHKREVSSYQSIAAEVKLPPAEICFFSDIPEELAAAQSAGMQVVHLVREGTAPSTFPGIKSFAEYKL